MIGSLEANVLEHSLVPPFRLIDFGMAGTKDLRHQPPDTQNANIYQGAPSNVRKAAEVGVSWLSGPLVLTITDGDLFSFRNRP